jgi:hypothetical protein
MIVLLLCVLAVRVVVPQGFVWGVAPSHDGKFAAEC